MRKRKDVVITDFETDRDNWVRQVSALQKSIIDADRKFGKEVRDLNVEILKSIGRKYKGQIFSRIEIIHRGYRIAITTDNSKAEQKSDPSVKNIEVIIFQNGNIDVSYCFWERRNRFNFELEILRPPRRDVCNPKITQISKKNVTMDQLFAEIPEIIDYLLSAEHPLKQTDEKFINKTFGRD
jgi:hypothetical protein